jgi:hypothetical protein
MGKKFRIGKKGGPINYGLTFVNVTGASEGLTVAEQLGRCSRILQRGVCFGAFATYFNTFIRTSSIRVSLTLTISNS